MWKKEYTISMIAVHPQRVIYRGVWKNPEGRLGPEMHHGSTMVHRGS
jgi:hypothetical protein